MVSFFIQQYYCFIAYISESRPYCVSCEKILNPTFFFLNVHWYTVIFLDSYLKGHRLLRLVLLRILCCHRVTHSVMELWFSNIITHYVIVPFHHFILAFNNSIFLSKSFVAWNEFAVDVAFKPFLPLILYSILFRVIFLFPCLWLLLINSSSPPSQFHFFEFQFTYSFFSSYKQGLVSNVYSPSERLRCFICSFLNHCCQGCFHCFSVIFVSVWRMIFFSVDN